MTPHSHAAVHPARRPLRRAAIVAAVLTLAAVTGLAGTPAFAAPAIHDAATTPSTHAASGAPMVRYRPTGTVTGTAADKARTASGDRSGYGIFNGFNWGGYVMYNFGSRTMQASTDWIEPTVDCVRPNDLMVFSPWVGLDGFGSSTVEQIGVQTDCAGTAPAYQLWTETYPAPPLYQSTTTYPIGPGDIMAAGVQYVAGTFLLTMDNYTRGWSYQAQTTLSGLRGVSVEAVIESPTGYYPNFGSINFMDTQFDGVPIGQVPAQHFDASHNGVTQAHTNPTLNGNDWSITYLHS